MVAIYFLYVVEPAYHILLIYKVIYVCQSHLKIQKLNESTQVNDYSFLKRRTFLPSHHKIRAHWIYELQTPPDQYQSYSTRVRTVHIL